MELKDLCGEHELSGVDFVERDVPAYEGANYTERCNVCRFRLDGTTYEAIENPSDGYRSSMRDLVVGEEPTTNEWEPVRVVASYVTQGEYGGESDLLEIRDVKTGGVVLCVGTENVDDYYPGFVSYFDPTALAHNAVKR